MTHSIMQAAKEAAKATVHAISEADPNERNNGPAIAASMCTRTSEPTLKQPTFNWKSPGKYN